MICIFSVCGLDEDQRKSLLAFQFSDGNIDTKIKKVGHTKDKILKTWQNMPNEHKTVTCQVT